MRRMCPFSDEVVIEVQLSLGSGDLDALIMNNVLKSVFRQIRCVKWLDVMYVDSFHTTFLFNTDCILNITCNMASHVILPCLSVYFHSVNIPNSLQIWLSLLFFPTHFVLLCQYICHSWFSWLAFVQHVSKILPLPLKSPSFPHAHVSILSNFLHYAFYPFLKN